MRYPSITVDFDGGELYGFPKIYVIPDGELPNIIAWIVKQGVAEDQVQQMIVENKLRIQNVE